MSVTLTIAFKELKDHGRDLRSLASTGLYVAMGPLLVLLVSIARPTAAAGQSNARVLVLMMSVFTILAAFTASVGMVLDTLAGERERRSLLPLLLNGISPAAIVLGKWLASCVFGAAGFLACLIAFVAVFAFVRDGALESSQSLLWVGAPMLALVVSATALELLVSLASRTVKEAHTWLSILVFVMMALTMWLAFRPEAGGLGWQLVPVAGQQRLLEGLFLGNVPAPLHAGALAVVTAALAAPLLAGAQALLGRDAIHGH